MSSILIAGISLASLLFLFSAGEFLVFETNDQLVDLNIALAVSTSDIAKSSESNSTPSSFNASTTKTNSTDTTVTNGSISIITPQEIEDRRHAPS